MFREILRASLLVIVAGMSMSPTAHAATGKSVVQSACAACHASGVAGAPKLGSAVDWGPRIDKGIAALYRSALQGTDKGMPPKGGRSDLPDADVKAAVDYMVAQAGIEPKAAAEKTAKKEKDAAKAPATRQVSGKAAYEATCAACHGTGLAGAPRLGVPEDWAPRIARGVETLHASALKGTDKGMPAKGGNADLSEVEIKAAVDYMIAQAKDTKPAPAQAASPTTVAAAPPAHVSVAEANAFNRLLRPPGKRNLAPADDGIHDPENDGTLALQPPLQAFDGLPRSSAGNRINWVQALGENKIGPRWDRLELTAEPIVMDLNIVRKVKGSMPDVVYPHKQHTEWLDCSNCHPAIFVPQSGGNQISMAAILLGQKCGVCHGKVAFPVSECRLCHSKKKDGPATAAATEAPKK